ncbi:BTAD domain-containing putative transcriptional regulator [Streptomyces sp. NPDC002328]|uniref:AfsR/SARP family transcriptional regulator n=1 Tax=Streptomyces sp. NPDC002328 TaxID=3364642 RepID=UPI0036887FA8
MHFRILGSPELYDDVRRRHIPLNAPKQRLLLGALVSHPHRTVSREALVRELWGAKPPRKSASTLNAHVSLLRKALLDLEPQRAHAPRIVARGCGYLLEAAPAETDFGRFRQALARARRTAAADPDHAYATLREALGLWRGTVLEGGAHGPLCAQLAARLDEERQQALELLFDCALRTGLHRYVVPELEEVAAAHPRRERFHDQLMEALCGCGREADAIGVYHRARRHLPAGADGAPLLTARLARIGARSLVPAAPGADPLGAGRPEADQEVHSVSGYLRELLSGQILLSARG